MKDHEIAALVNALTKKAQSICLVPISGQLREALRGVVIQHLKEAEPVEAKAITRPFLVHTELALMTQNAEATKDYIGRLERANRFYADRGDDWKERAQQNEKQYKKALSTLCRVEDALWNAPELNMCNYTHEQVRDLNNAMIEVSGLLSYILVKAPEGSGGE